MKLYNALVRLDGSLYHEVYKTGLTAAELHVLQIVHGEGSVAKVTAGDGEAKSDLRFNTNGKPKTRSDREEKERLQGLYGGALAKREDVRTVDGVFGVGRSLPSTFELSEEEDEDDDLDDVEQTIVDETVQRTATASASRDDIHNNPYSPSLLKAAGTEDLGPRPADNVSAKQQTAQQTADKTPAVVQEAKGQVQDTETRLQADKDTPAPRRVETKQVGKQTPAAKTEDQDI